MIIKKINCKSCGTDISINTYRKFAVCPSCDNRIRFDGFEYREIDWGGSMYAYVKLWSDCPVCRSPNMYLGPERKAWKCPDCGYLWSEKERRRGVLWFCDECETYMNMQEGFNTKKGTWVCKECGYQNDVTKRNII